MKWISATVDAAMAVIVALAALQAGSADAQSVIRGPYLQSATPDSIIVKWRTDVVTDAELSFGPAPGNLGSSAVSQTVATDHEVRLQGLQPRTRSSSTTVTASAAAPIAVRVASASNDAEEKQSGSVSLTSSDLELADDGSRNG